MLCGRWRRPDALQDVTVYGAGERGLRESPTPGRLGRFWEPSRLDGRFELAIDLVPSVAHRSLGRVCCIVLEPQ